MFQRLEPRDAKYLATLRSGRTLILNSGYDVYQAAYDAYEEACMMDDYLINVELIELLKRGRRRAYQAIG